MTACDTFQQLFADDIFQALLLSEVDEEQAAKLTISIYHRIQKNWGGCDVYIPNGGLAEKINRNTLIRQAFNGHNHEELAREFGVHRRTIERIVKK